MVKHFEAQRQRELKEARDAAQAEEDRINAYQKAMDDRGAGVKAKLQAKKEGTRVDLLLLLVSIVTLEILSISPTLPISNNYYQQRTIGFSTRSFKRRR